MMNGDEYLNISEVNEKINNRTASFDKCFPELYLLSKVFISSVFAYVSFPKFLNRTSI